MVKFHKFFFQHASTAGADNAIDCPLRLCQDFHDLLMRYSLPGFFGTLNFQFGHRRGDFIVIGADRRFGFIMHITESYQMRLFGFVGLADDQLFLLKTF